ncbi:MAG: phosphatase PAP2 family protein [Thermomicrobiales bacterium]
MSEPISPEPPESPQESKPSLRAALSARDPNAIKAAIRPSHILRLVLAVVLMIVSYYTNRGFLGWGLLFILGVLVVPVGRTRAFLIGFIPYAGVWFLFTVGRSLADETIFARTVNLYVPDFERQLFNDRLPTVRLQDRFFTPGDPGPLDYFMTGVHWSYFIIPHVFAVIIWYKRPELFLRFFSAMTLMLGIGLAIYFLIPTNPPWLAPEPINSPSAAVVYRVMESVGKAIGGGIYEASYAVIGESNPRAAMPSIHLAFTALLIFPAFAFGKSGAICSSSTRRSWDLPWCTWASTTSLIWPSDSCAPRMAGTAPEHGGTSPRQTFSGAATRWPASRRPPQHVRRRQPRAPEPNDLPPPRRSAQRGIARTPARREYRAAPASVSSS